MILQLAVDVTLGDPPDRPHTATGFEAELRLADELNRSAQDPTLRGSRYTDTEMDLVQQCANRVAQAIAFFGPLR